MYKEYNKAIFHRSQLKRNLSSLNGEKKKAKKPVMFQTQHDEAEISYYLP